MRPDLTRVPAYYHNYINQAVGEDLNQILQEQAVSFRKFLDELPPSKRDHRYAEGKWSIKELLQHIVDAERVFSYRALCIARKDTTPLPSFDENHYQDNAKTENRDWDDLVEEFSVTRHSTVILFRSFDEEQLEATGTASNASNYVRAFGFIIAGHVAHHLKIIRERYL